MPPPEEEKPPCPLCGGKGRTVVDNLTVRLCVCLQAKMCRDFLGTDLVLAERITSSPVYEAKKSLDRTGENLFLKTKWRPFRPHLRYALGSKWFANDAYRFRVVTDERLFQVYIGNESYTQRSKAKRDERESYNNLADLIGDDIDLVIIRLGFLGWKNVAAPGVLKTALMIREAALKPTWLVTCDLIYGPNHYSYSTENQEYIDERFDVIDFSKEQAAEVSDRTPTMAVEDVTASGSKPEPPEPPGGSFDAIASDDSDLFGESRVGSAKPGQRPKKSNWNNNKKKPSGGGSPVGDL